MNLRNLNLRRPFKSVQFFKIFFYYIQEVPLYPGLLVHSGKVESSSFLPRYLVELNVN